MGEWRDRIEIISPPMLRDDLPFDEWPVHVKRAHLRLVERAQREDVSNGVRSRLPQDLDACTRACRSGVVCNPAGAAEYGWFEVSYTW